MDSNIKNIVEIVLEVSKQVQAKADLELELVSDELTEANKEIEELRGQKERQANTIQELMEKLDNTDGLADDYYQSLESLNEKMNAQEEEIRRLEEMNEKLKAENKELTKKLKEAEQRGDAVVRRSENWIRPSEKEPPTETWVIVTTQTGAVIDARYVMGKNGMEWQRSNYQPIREPLAWMSKPEPVEKEAIA